MVYVYKKTIGNKNYYYLRATVKKNNKSITKDIAYLGSNINEIKNKLNSLSSKYSKEIRKTYKTINRFIEANRYLQKINSLKIKTNSYISNSLLKEIEACKLHWDSSFNRMDYTTKQETLKNFLIEFAFNTASIEGNTITLKETQNLLIENLTPKNRTLREIYDLQNTEKVFFELYNQLNQKIDHKLICFIHDELLKNIDERKGYRTIDVRVFKSNFESTPAPYVLTDMNLLINWYKKNEKIMHPFVLAVIFHHKLEKIHPFMDGNGRTGRMLLNYMLMSKRYPPMIFQKKNREEYLKTIRLADKSGLTGYKSENYKNLVDFSAEEHVHSYWNIFL